MAKKIWVDGFNVIRRDIQLSQIERQNFMAAQEALAERMALYRRGTTHQISVVFDGRHGENPYRHKKIIQGIEVIYSAQGETADEVIVDLAEKSKKTASGCMVVTADRNLGLLCKRLGVVVLAPEELMRQTRRRVIVRRDPEYVFGKKEEASWSGNTIKKGNPRRLPKNKRKPRALW